MEPFKNNNFTNKNISSFGYTNLTEASKPENSYKINNFTNPESYFNPPYIENISNIYNANYLFATNEANNNYSYTFPKTISSEKNNNNYNNYSIPSHKNENFANVNLIQRPINYDDYYSSKAFSDNI